MKHLKHSPDLSGWGVEAIEKVGRSLNDALLEALTEVLGGIFEGDETYIYFPVEWSGHKGRALGGDGIGGPEVADPLTVYLRVGMESQGEKPTYRFNLRDALARSLTDCAHDGSFSEGLGRLSEALRTWADEIDAARAQGNRV